MMATWPPRKQGNDSSNSKARARGRNDSYVGPRASEANVAPTVWRMETSARTVDLASHARGSQALRRRPAPPPVSKVRVAIGRN